jgi:hypothetical protein
LQEGESKAKLQGYFRPRPSRPLLFERDVDSSVPHTNHRSLFKNTVPIIGLDCRRLSICCAESSSPLCYRRSLPNACTALRYTHKLVADAPEITVLQLPKFKAEATELIGAEGIEAVAVYLIDHPNAGPVIPGAGGVRKLRWSAKGKGKRGGARIVYLYIVIAARVYLLRCYAKNVKANLTAEERKGLRQIAANLKGVY